MEGEGDHGVDGDPVRDARDVPIPHDVVCNSLTEDNLSARLDGGVWWRG